MNREQWLMDVGSKLAPLFRGFKLPAYRISCGWPVKNPLGKFRRALGECHPIETSASGVFEVFISPTLDNPMEVAGVVCHEMAHVAAGTKAAHGSGFVRVCKHVGLTKNPPTSAAPGERLAATIQRLIEPLGEYPHKALIPQMNQVAKRPPRITLECTCGCKCSMSADDLVSYGLPTCGCGLEFSLREKDA